MNCPYCNQFSTNSEGYMIPMETKFTYRTIYDIDGEYNRQIKYLDVRYQCHGCHSYMIATTEIVD